MTWNYRIIEFAEHRALHEVYYDDDRFPTDYSEGPISFVEYLGGGIVDSLQAALRDARDLPVLPVSVFGLPVGERPKTPCRLGTSA